MIAAGNKTKRLSSVNHLAKKTIQFIISNFASVFIGNECERSISYSVYFQSMSDRISPRN